MMLITVTPFFLIPPQSPQPLISLDPTSPRSISRTFCTPTHRHPPFSPPPALRSLFSLAALAVPPLHSLPRRAGRSSPSFSPMPRWMLLRSLLSPTIPSLPIPLPLQCFLLIPTAIVGSRIHCRRLASAGVWIHGRHGEQLWTRSFIS